MWGLVVRLLSNLAGEDMAEPAVAAARVVPALDVGEESQARVGLRRPGAPAVSWHWRMAKNRSAIALS